MKNYFFFLCVIFFVVIPLNNICASEKDNVFKQIVKETKMDISQNMKDVGISVDYKNYIIYINVRFPFYWKKGSQIEKTQLKNQMRNIASQDAKMIAQIKKYNFIYIFNYISNDNYLIPIILCPADFK